VEILQWINIAIIHKDADSDFGASFPDFPGCITAGRSVSGHDQTVGKALRMNLVLPGTTG
jgi:hypothetical protein